MIQNIDKISEEINSCLLTQSNFAIAYNQIKNNSEIQIKFEKQVGLNWQLCGVVAAYSGVASSDVNHYLRGANQYQSATYIATFSRLLTLALENLCSINESCLCRNESFPSEIIDKIRKWYTSKVGSIVMAPCFYSTSFNWQPVENRQMFKIYTKHFDSKAKDIREIMKVFQPERGKSEQEILFDKKTYFKIIAVTEQIISLQEIDLCTENNAIELVAGYWNL